jgi:hypothetical protein
MRSASKKQKKIVGPLEKDWEERIKRLELEVSDGKEKLLQLNHAMCEIMSDLNALKEAKSSAIEPTYTPKRTPEFNAGNDAELDSRSDSGGSESPMAGSGSPKYLVHATQLVQGSGNDRVDKADDIEVRYKSAQVVCSGGSCRSKDRRFTVKEGNVEVATQGHMFMNNACMSTHVLLEDRNILHGICRMSSDAGRFGRQYSY